MNHRLKRTNGCKHVGHARLSPFHRGETPSPDATKPAEGRAPLTQAHLGDMASLAHALPPRKYPVRHGGAMMVRLGGVMP